MLRSWLCWGAGSVGKLVISGAGNVEELVVLGSW